MKAAEALGDIPFDVIASSSLSRCKETADIIFKYQQQQQHSSSSSSRNNGKTKQRERELLPQRIVDEGFNEMRFGEFEGFLIPHKIHNTGSSSANSGASSSNTRNDKNNANDDPHKLKRFRTAKRKVADDPDYRFPGGAVRSTNSNNNNNNDDEHDDYDDGNDGNNYDATGEGEGESTRMVENRSMRALAKAIAAATISTSTYIEINKKKTRDDDKNNNDSDSDGDENDDDVNSIHQHRHIAIISHGRTNKIMIASMLYGDAHPRFKEIKRGNTAINVLDWCNSSTTMPSSIDNINGDETTTDDDSNSNSNSKIIWTARKLNYIDHVEGHVLES